MRSHPACLQFPPEGSRTAASKSLATSSDAFLCLSFISFASPCKDHLTGDNFLLDALGRSPLALGLICTLLLGRDARHHSEVIVPEWRALQWRNFDEVFETDASP